jgi:hypothetical protein
VQGLDGDVAVHVRAGQHAVDACIGSAKLGPRRVHRHLNIEKRRAKKKKKKKKKNKTKRDNISMGKPASQKRKNK